MRYKIPYKKLALFLSITVHYTIAYSQKNLVDYMLELNKATTPIAKADICFEISNLYSTRLKIDSAIYFANQVKAYSEPGNYATGIGKYHLVYAIALTYRAKNEEVVQNALKAIDIFTRQNEKILCGRTFLVLGSTQHENNVTASRQNYWKAVACFYPAHDAKSLYSAYRWLAYSYFKTAEIDSASFYQLKSLEMAEKLSDAEKIYQSASWVGSTFLSLGDLNKSIQYFEYGFMHRTPFTDKVGLRSVLVDYATSMALIHQFKKADSLIKEIQILNNEFNDPYGEVLLNGLNGILAFERKNYPVAVSDLNEALKKRDEQELFDTETKSLLLFLGKAEFEMHKYDSAIVHLREAATQSRKLGFLIDEEEANMIISKCFQQKGNADSALYYFENYSLLKDSVLSQQKQKNIVEYAAKYEAEKKEQDIKLLEKEAAYQKLLLAKQSQQKKTVYSGLAFFLLLTGYVIYRYMRKKRLDNVQEVLNERLRISRELHDEVGATLSGVALYSEIAKQKMEQNNPAGTREYLQHISDNSKEMVEKMSDIVWSLSPENDSYEQIVKKIKSYAFNLCVSKGIHLHLNIAEEICNEYPVTQVKKNLYLFMKEAVNNAIKYADAKNIYLSLHKKGNKIIAEIKDDGKGFDTALPGVGNGLISMKERADILQGDFTIESVKEKGTTISLHF